jgi:hypothetical protein
MRTRTAVARVAVAIAAIFTAAVGGATARAAVPAQSTSTAVVIVDTGSGVHQSVIHFDGTVSGLGALQLAGANPVTIDYGGSLGQAVCQLYGVGDAAVPSQCPGGWVYYRAIAGAGSWTQSSAGASNTTVHDGDVEGWKYGGGQPPFSSYCAVVGCAPPPTEPPPATVAPPPVTAAPPGPGASSDPGNTSPTTSPKASNPSGMSGDDAGARPADSAGTKDATTTTGKTGTKTGDRSARHAQSDSAQVAAGGNGGGGSGGSGSPIGVIVAVALVAAGVVGGLWLRRRRRGPAPG